MAGEAPGAIQLGLYSLRLMACACWTGLLGMISTFMPNETIAWACRALMVAIVLYQVWVFFRVLQPSYKADLARWEAERPAREEAERRAALQRERAAREDYRAALARAMANDPRGLAPVIEVVGPVDRKVDHDD